MRAYFRAKPFGASVPRFLALPAIVLWGALAIFFWICAGVWIVARFATQQVQRVMRALNARRAS